MIETVPFAIRINSIRTSEEQLPVFAWLTQEEWQAVRLSLAVAAASVALATPAAILAAWLLTRPRLAGRWLLDSVVHLPLVVPPVVVGWLLLLAFGVRGPLGAVLLHWFGVRLVFTTAGAALATAVMVFPLIVRAVSLSFLAVDPALHDAARTLGAGPLACFFTITLPLAAPGILSGAVSAFAASLGQFGAVITFAANIPGETQTLPLAIYAAIQVPGDELTAARLAVVSVGLAVMVLIPGEALCRWLRR